MGGKCGGHLIAATMQNRAGNFGIQDLLFPREEHNKETWVGTGNAIFVSRTGIECQEWVSEQSLLLIG